MSIRRAEENAITEQVVNKLLSKLSSLPYAKPIDSDMVGDWLAVLRREAISQAELAEAYLRIISTATEWVALASIIADCRIVRRERTPYPGHLSLPTGEPITPEQRDEILRSLKHPEFALAVIEGRGKARTYRIHTDDAVIPDVEARRDDQIRKMRGGE